MIEPPIISASKNKEKLMHSQTGLHLSGILLFHNAIEIIIALWTPWKVAGMFLTIWTDSEDDCLRAHRRWWHS